MSDAARSSPGRRVVVQQVELTASLQPLAHVLELASVAYDAARVLVRLDEDPVGIVTVDLHEPLDATQLAHRLWAAVGAEVTERRARQGALVPAGLGPDGIASLAPNPAGAPRPVTVVIATRDRPGLLRACLSSLQASDHPDFEIIVVDSAPTTTTTAALVQDVAWHDPRVRYLREDRPGPAAAHDWALAHVVHELVVFTHDDVIVDERWLRRLAMAFQLAPDVAYLTGLTLPLELITGGPHVLDPYSGLGAELVRRVVSPSDVDALATAPLAVRSLGSGVNLACTTAFLREHGGFHVGDGDPLAAVLGVLMSGNRVVYEPAAVVLQRPPVGREPHIGG